MAADMTKTWLPAGVTHEAAPVSLYVAGTGERPVNTPSAEADALQPRGGGQ